MHSHILNIVHVVQSIREGATSRIPPELRGKAQFFSENNLWLFDALGDPDVRCVRCEHHNGNVFPGRTIRFQWQYLKILGINKIGGPGANGNGLVHPHCKCVLHRMPEDWTPSAPFDEPVVGKPTFDVNPPVFRVALLQFLIVKTVWDRLFNELSVDERRVLKYVRERNGTISTLACALFLKLTEEQVKTILVKLRKKGIIRG